MPGASGEWQEDILTAEPELSLIEKALVKLMPSYQPPKMDPEIRDIVMGFGPGQLPTAAGIFTSNIANAVRKGLADYYPSTGGRKHIARLMDMLKEVPQSVMDRIEKFTLTKERPVYGKNIPVSALGVYAPLGKRESLKKMPEYFKEEIQKASPRLMPEVEVQGIDLAKGRTGQDVIDTIVHEIPGHSVVDAIRRKVGWKGSEQLIDVGAKDPLFSKALQKGREEPFAEMIESLSPGEYRELMQPYFKALEESPGVRLFGASERARVDKAIRRARQRMQKGRKND